jgi:hypothetical protein
MQASVGIFSRRVRPAAAAYAHAQMRESGNFYDRRETHATLGLYKSQPRLFDRRRDCLCGSFGWCSHSHQEALSSFLVSAIAIVTADFAHEQLGCPMFGLVLANMGAGSKPRPFLLTSPPASISFQITLSNSHPSFPRLPVTILPTVS